MSGTFSHFFRVVCGQPPGSPFMPLLGRACDEQVGHDRAELRGVVDGLRARAAHPTFGDGEHLAAGLEHAAGDVGRLLATRAR